MLIATPQDFLTALANGPFTSFGGYNRYFIMKDGAALSYAAAEENKDLICTALNDGCALDWIPFAVEINYEDNALYCAHTSQKIDPAYCD